MTRRGVPAGKAGNLQSDIIVEVNARRPDAVKRVLIASLLVAACNRDAVEEKATPPAVTQTVVTQTVVTQTAPPAIAGPKLLPVDEAPRDPDLVAYRDQLLDAVRRRDVEALVFASDPNIRTSFGDGGGSNALREMFARPEMWSELEQVLTHGGTFREGSFWAPYVYSAWPDSVDAFEWLAVIAKDAALRDAPNSRAIATLSHDLVQRVAEPEGGWQQVKTADGRTGFVEMKFVRSPVGYRAGFNKTDNRWRMTAIVAGD